MPAKTDLTGCVFAQLTVLRQAHTPAWANRPFWECRCECGTIVIVAAGNLRSGNTKSCGCRNIRVLRERMTTHGHAPQKRQSPEYLTWCRIIARCENANEPGYKNYGGRGIRMCQRWRESFEAFLRDMGPKPSPQHSIERIDNDGDYEPTNCCWATRTEQANNRRNNHRIVFNGRTQTLMQWSRELGLRREQLKNRLKRGWSVERAFTTPIAPPNIYHPRRSHE